MSTQLKLGKFSEPQPLPSGRRSVHPTTTIGLRAEHVLNPVSVESVEVQEMVDHFPEGAMELLVASLDPKFDAEQQRWYVDIHIDATDVCFPFVRLALVRHQFHSVPSEEVGKARELYSVSPIVLAEPVPLLPERRLRTSSTLNPEFVPLEDQSFAASLTGTTYVLPSSEVAGSLPRARATVTARCQRRTGQRITGTGDDWVTIKTFPFRRSSDDTAWTFGVPATELADVERILVVEEDHAPYDPAVPQPTTHASRVVYAEVIRGPFITLPIDPGVDTGPVDPTE
jgi:hypothetical protein